MSKIILHPADIETARVLAVTRHTNKRGSKLFTPIAETDAGFIGALGEIAFSKLTGLPVDDTRYIGGDAGDFVYNGKTWEIKTRDTSRYKTPDLMVRVDYARAHYYVLATVDSTRLDCVELCGYIDHAKLVNRQPVKLARTLSYVVKRDELRPIRQNTERIKHDTNRR